MCTAIAMTADNGEIVMGRTMDFSHPLHPQFFRVPAGYRFRRSAAFSAFTTRYRFVGVGQNFPPLTFADGANEAGLSIAALYFPGYAHYDNPSDCGGKQLCIASTDMTFYILGMCGKVEDAIAVFQDACIVGVEDAVTGSISPLHWMLCDVSGRCVTIEKTADGVLLYENPLGVLTNSPDFNWQQTNLRNYKNVMPDQNNPIKWSNGVSLTPFGQAAGTFGLPGDFTSPGRFVRTAWLKAHTTDIPTGKDAIYTGFHILGNVTIPKGCVITGTGSMDYTQYVVLFHLNTFQCYFKEYTDIPRPLS